jgi:hypothetical protein
MLLMHSCKQGGLTCCTALLLLSSGLFPMHVRAQCRSTAQLHLTSRMLLLAMCAGGLKALPAAFPGPRLAASLTSLALSDCYGIKV